MVLPRDFGELRCASNHAGVLGNSPVHILVSNQSGDADCRALQQVQPQEFSSGPFGGGHQGSSCSFIKSLSPSGFPLIHVSSFAFCCLLSCVVLEIGLSLHEVSRL